MKNVVKGLAVAVALAGFVPAAQALTVSEAIAASQAAGYSVLMVRTARDGSAVSALVTDGTTYYDITYDSTTGEATSTTEVTVNTDRVSTSSASDVNSAVAAAEAAGYTVLAVRTTNSGVKVLATDGTTMYEVEYEDGTVTTEVEDNPHLGGDDHGRRGRGSDDSSDDSSDDDSVDDDSDDDHGRGRGRGRGGDDDGDDDHGRHSDDD